MRGRGKEERRKVAGAAVVLKGGSEGRGCGGSGKRKGGEKGRGFSRHQTRLVVYPKAV